MHSIAITDQEFRRFQRLIFDIAGISMSDEKKALVSGRLAKRLKFFSLNSYDEYFRLLSRPEHGAELQMAVDLLTTNETYFFREPRHFDFLRDEALTAATASRPFRVWSGAASSGEEAYSIAMVLAERLGAAPWEVVGTDISTRVLERARSGHYPIERARTIPHDYLVKHCLKGQGAQEGTMLIDRKLRGRVKFVHANLNAALPDLGLFDVIFLRNVMIYFNAQTKSDVVARMLPALRSGGYFIVGHSESLNGVTAALQPVLPSVYRKS